MNLSELTDNQLMQHKKELERKRSYADTQQQVRKVLANAFYGAMANSYFRWYDLAIPTSVTLTGQWYLKTIANDINEYLKNKYGVANDLVVYGDTDSVYFTLWPIIENEYKDKSKKEIVDKCLELCQDVDKFIKESFDRYGKEKNVFENLMKMKRENIIDQSLFVSKKRYICNVVMGESGQFNEKGKLKIMGLELVKASTPKPVKEKLKEAVKFILNGEQGKLKAFVKEAKAEFKALSPDKIAFPRGVNDIGKWMHKSNEIHSSIKSGTPIHVKGSIYYNLLCEEKGLNHERIIDKSKVKFIYLKNNPYKLSVISWPNEFPSDIIDPEFVDYELQFEKTFFSVLKMLVEPMKWDIETTKRKITGFFK